MGYIPENQINDLKDRIDIVDIISEYVNLKRAGSSYKGLCPFHHEKTPSFSVSPERNNFHCFGCHEGGDAISFIMKIENLGYLEAIKFIADKMGITLEEEQYSESKTQKRQRMYEINSLAAKYYMKNLLTHKMPQDYMDQRGLKKSILNRFFLGYAKSTQDRANDDLIKYLESKKVSREEMDEIGLTNTKDGRQFDRFTDRLIFPILDSKNKVIGFGGRTLVNSKIKYINSPESQIFIKGHNLYGVNIVNKSRNRSRIILVEGYMDVIGLYNQGIDYAVATLGTAMTQDQANLVKRYGKNIFIAYDGDEAGIKATLRAIDIFKNMDVNLGVLALPDGMDPDEYVIKHGREKFEDLMDKAVNPIDFKLQKLYEKHPNKLDFIKKIIEFLADIDGNTIRDLYTSKAANFIGTSVDSLRQDVSNKRSEIDKKQSAKNRQNSYQSGQNGYKSRREDSYYNRGQKSINQKSNVSVNNSNDGRLQSQLLVMSLLGKDKFDNLKEHSDIIKDPQYSSIYNDISQAYKDKEHVEDLVKSDQFKSLEISKTYQMYKDNERIDDVIEELIGRIERHKLLIRKRDLEEKLKSEGFEEGLNSELNDILKKLT